MKRVWTDAHNIAYMKRPRTRARLHADRHCRQAQHAFAEARWHRRGRGKSDLCSCTACLVVRGRHHRRILCPPGSANVFASALPSSITTQSVVPVPVAVSCLFIHCTSACSVPSSEFPWVLPTTVYVYCIVTCATGIHMARFSTTTMSTVFPLPRNTYSCGGAVIGLRTNHLSILLPLAVGGAAHPASPVAFDVDKAKPTQRSVPFLQVLNGARCLLAMLALVAKCSMYAL